jgi:hypothetical protein
VWHDVRFAHLHLVRALRRNGIQQITKGLHVMASQKGRLPQKAAKVIGAAPVHYTSHDLYLTMSGGTFEGEGVKGRFTSTIDGSAIIVYINGGGSYQCRARDVIEAAIAHHKTLPQKVKPDEDS